MTVKVVPHVEPRLIVGEFFIGDPVGQEFVLKGLGAGIRALFQHNPVG